MSDTSVYFCLSHVHKLACLQRRTINLLPQFCPGIPYLINEYKKRHSARKMLHWREFLNDFHQKNLQSNVPQSLKPSSKAATPLSIETLGDLRDARTVAAVARRYLPMWGLIKDACASSTHSIRSKPHVLNALITLCRIKPQGSGGILS